MNMQVLIKFQCNYTGLLLLLFDNNSIITEYYDYSSSTLNYSIKKLCYSLNAKCLPWARVLTA